MTKNEEKCFGVGLITLSGFHFPRDAAVASLLSLIREGHVDVTLIKLFS